MGARGAALIESPAGRVFFSPFVLPFDPRGFVSSSSSSSSDFSSSPSLSRFLASLFFSLVLPFGLALIVSCCPAGKKDFDGQRLQLREWRTDLHLFCLFSFHRNRFPAAEETLAVLVVLFFRQQTFASARRRRRRPRPPPPPRQPAAVSDAASDADADR